MQALMSLYTRLIGRGVIQFIPGVAAITDSVLHILPLSGHLYPGVPSIRAVVPQSRNLASALVSLCPARLAAYVKQWNVGAAPDKHVKQLAVVFPRWTPVSSLPVQTKPLVALHEGFSQGNLR